MRQTAATPALGGAHRASTRSVGSARPRVAFHPHRLHPRYAFLFGSASHVPGGLAAAARLLGRVAFDRAPSETENATDADVASAQVAVCGFPRTGTTFMQRTIITALADESACFKNHDPLAVERFAEAGLTTLITLRDPLETVVSWSLYHQDQPCPQRLSARLSAYVAWHREARRQARSPWATVVDFDEFCQQPTVMISTLLGVDVEDEVTTETISARVRSGNTADQRAIAQGNVPDWRRDALKSPYLDAAQHPRVQPVLATARRVHAALAASTFRLTA